ncbi:hypothetical protein EDD15DRAFT_2202601 [Pisolithus albus]|nr:hypothetical protein EDD15DRAFT_2202601 [Pisolithus albus]
MPQGGFKRFLGARNGKMCTFTIQDPPAGYRSRFEGKEKSRSSRMRMRATRLYSSSITLRKGLGLDSQARGAVFRFQSSMTAWVWEGTRSMFEVVLRWFEPRRQSFGHAKISRLFCITLHRSRRHPLPPFTLTIHVPATRYLRRFTGVKELSECRSRFEGIERGGSGHMRVRSVKSVGMSSMPFGDGAGGAALSLTPSESAYPLLVASPCSPLPFSPYWVSCPM